MPHLWERSGGPPIVGMPSFAEGLHVATANLAGARTTAAAMGAFVRGVLLAPVLVLGLVVATGPAHGAGEAIDIRPARAPAPPLRVEPASAPAPGSTESGGEQFDGRPGRENPEEFYKKPPRKPKVKTRMHA